MTCKYKDVLGRPGEGFHSVRLFDLAVYDIAGTLLLAYLLSSFAKIPLYIAMALMFLLGIVLHRLFCVRTTVDKLLFE